MNKLGLVFVVVVVASFCSLSATSVRAQSAGDERAQLHFHAGNDSYHRGDYESALREFQIALELSGRAELHFNLSSCFERLDRDGEAADELERYLAAAPDAPNREALTERLGRLRARAAAHLATPPTDPPPDVMDAPPEDEAPTAAPSSAAPPARGPHPAAWGVLGAGALGLVAFGVLGALALVEDGALASECGTRCAPERVAGLETLSIGADVSLGIGAALAAVGLVLALTVQEEAPLAPAVTLMPGGLRVAF